MRLELDHIYQKYGEQELFVIDELQLITTDAVHLHGPNGAGKSTLMKIMAGLQKPTSGQVRCIPTQGETLRQQAVIYLHQNTYLFDMDVRSNVEYGLRLRREKNPEKVDDALAWAGLDHLQERQAHLLSGGERQRLALARALVLDPALVLLDEIYEEFHQNYNHHQTSPPGGTAQSSTGGKATGRTTISGVGGQAVNYPWEASAGRT